MAETDRGKAAGSAKASKEPAGPADPAAKKPAAKRAGAASRKPAAKRASAASKEPAAKRASAASKEPAQRAPAAAKPTKSAGSATRKPAKVTSAPRTPAKAAVGVTTAPTVARKDTPRAVPKRAVVQETARSYFEALAARDADRAARAWGEGGVDDIVPLGIFRGRAAIRALLLEMFTAMPDSLFSVERITADDKVAAVQWRVVGTFSGASFQGLEPTGRRVDLRGSDCLQIEDGKIVHNTGIFDGAAFARQVGLLPPEDSGADRAIRAGFNTVTKLRRTVARRTPR